MSYIKYLQDNPQQLRTDDGFPIRGNNNLLLRREELEEMTLSFDARCRIFDLSVPEQLQDYTAVLDRIANEQFIRLAPDREMEDKERRTWLVLCRWAEVKGDVPPHLLSATGVKS